MTADLLVDGSTYLLGAEDALFPLLDLLHNLRVVGQLAATLPEHLQKYLFRRKYKIFIIVIEEAVAVIFSEFFQFYAQVTCQNESCFREGDRKTRIDGGGSFILLTQS